MICQPISRKDADQIYTWSARTEEIADGARLAEIRVSEPWVDLCWWNGRAWQYVTTRRDTLFDTLFNL
jgi:hypothetical protein